MNPRIFRLSTAALVALFVAACASAPIEPLPITAKEDVATSPVVREILPQPVIPAPVTATTSTPSPEASTSAPLQGQAAVPVTATPPPTTAQTQPPSKATGKTAKAKSTDPSAKSAAAKKGGTASAFQAPSLASAAPTSASSPPSASAPAAIPPGTLYVCSAMVDGRNQQTAIEFEPRIHTLCSRHPEMGVCQYEREQCRLSGGRVYTPGGEEITLRTEAEYDKKVLRVRFKAG